MKFVGYSWRHQSKFLKIAFQSLLLTLKKALDLFFISTKMRRTVSQKNWQHCVMFQTMLLTHFFLVNISILHPPPPQNRTFFWRFQEVWNETLASNGLQPHSGFFEAFKTFLKHFQVEKKDLNPIWPQIVAWGPKILMKNNLGHKVWGLQNYWQLC